jgi:hypothetical protein
MTTTQIGTVSELLVLTRLCREGASVAIPFGQQAGWDLLVEDSGKWLKIQVKTAFLRYKKRQPYVNCIRMHRSSDRHYKVGEFDLMIAVLPETDEMWRLPANVVIGRRALALTDAFKWTS